MFIPVKPATSWSKIGLWTLVGSIIASIVLAVLDGILRGGAVREMMANPGASTMIAVWVADFRFLTEQGVYASTVFFVGAKFFETRTMVTIGFDKLDAANIKLKGPDEDNTVWIGHRYRNHVEAELVASAFAERLKDSVTI